MGVFQTALALHIDLVRNNVLATPLVLIPRSEQLDELARLNSWKALDIERLPFERKYQKQFAAVLDAAGLAGSKASPKRAAAAVGSVLEARLPIVMRKVYAETTESFALRAEALANRILRVDGKAADFGDESDEVDVWLSVQTALRIKGVTAATIARVRELVMRGFRDGLTTDEIARSIRTSGQFTAMRAWRIARTEVVSASNAGNHFMTASKLSEARFDKQWSNSGDIRVRDTHITAHGQTVRMNAAFRLPGGRLRFPGDSTLGASAAEIVNCRCTTVYRPRRRRR